MTLPEAVKLMRGKPRTAITLSIARKGEDKPLEFKLMRDVIRVQSVRTRTIEPGYGFIRIPSSRSARSTTWSSRSTNCTSRRL